MHLCKLELLYDWIHEETEAIIALFHFDILFYPMNKSVESIELAPLSNMIEIIHKSKNIKLKNSIFKIETALKKSLNDDERLNNLT